MGFWVGEHIEMGDSGPAGKGREALHPLPYASLPSGSSGVTFFYNTPVI